MCMKTSLKFECVSNSQHQAFHEQAKIYKNCVRKTKLAHTKRVHTEIRRMNTRSPREFWKLLKTEASNHSTAHSPILFTDFIDHFRELNSDPVYSGDVPPLVNTVTINTTEVINQPFTIGEIKIGIKHLKNNKASGPDKIINEFFKHCHNDCLQLIVHFFNIVLNTGCVPTEWCLGIIRPLYKNKGSVTDPDNYRGITLLSCTSKLFTSCLNSRLSIYIDEHILGREQAGFREGYSTIDHVFILHIIIELYQSVHKRVYCAFIDYRKAFDSVNRSLLWAKLLSNGVNGKLFNVIKSIYSKAKSCIRMNDMMSDYMPCKIGVRQGDNLSPLLFSLFINDFNEHISKYYKGIDIASSCYPSLKTENIVLMNMFALLYADDTIILSENECELQSALDAVHAYCAVNKLIVNTSKTKIMIFSRGKVRRFPTFKYGTDIIEVVSNYVYLGVNMNYNNNFALAMRKQLDQGRKAQFSMLIKARKLDMPIDIQYNLFEKIVFPTLLYGCEVWGFQSIEMLETFYKKFIKKLLHLRPSTPNCMVYGEVGTFPLQVTVDKFIINYWMRILNKDNVTFTHLIYMISLNLFMRGEYEVKWLSRVKRILDNCGLSYVWYNQDTIDNKRCKSIIHRRIEDIALHNWYSQISTSSMCTMYRIFKKQLVFEKYLLNSNCRDRINLAKMRCSNGRIPVYNKIYMFDSDKCTLCNLNVSGNEYHYILICSHFQESRERYLKPYYYTRPTYLKFEQLLSSTNNRILMRFARFASIILNQF